MYARAVYQIGTPHRVPDRHRLAEIDDRLLGEVIALVAGESLPPDRLRMAGVPALAALQAERQRRNTMIEASS